MGIDKDDLITGGAALTAGIGGTALGGPLGGLAAATAAGAATKKYLSSDQDTESSDED